MPIPLLAAALPGIGSFLASKGVELLGSVFRGTVDKGMEKIAETIEEKTGIDISDAAEGKLTEEQLVKLKQFELEHEQMLLDYVRQIRELDIEEKRIVERGVADARQMQIAAMKQEDKFVKRYIYIYASVVTFLTFLFIFVVTVFPNVVTDGNEHIVDTVLGFLLGVSLSAIIQFFFGSSQGSSNKNEKIKELTDRILDIPSLRRG